LYILQLSTFGIECAKNAEAPVNPVSSRGQGSNSETDRKFGWRWAGKRAGPFSCPDGSGSFLKLASSDLRPNAGEIIQL
jgi:hypothetical protein